MEQKIKFRIAKSGFRLVTRNATIVTVIVFTDWLEPYIWKQSLSLYLSGREELKRRLYKLSVQVYKSDCAYD